MNKWQFGIEIVRIFNEKKRPDLAFIAFVIFVVLAFTPALVAAFLLLKQ
ncbi:hypothetical protein [Sphingomonas sp.]|nr:hypothetical protein [Sphingomonas sp.]